MASWSELAAESLTAAKTLLDEGLHRSSASRAYYAAYAASTAALESAGRGVAIGERPNPSHVQLLKLVRHNFEPWRHNAGQRQDVARRLRNLFRLRVMADYSRSAAVDRAAECSGRQCADGKLGTAMIAKDPGNIAKLVQDRLNRGGDRTSRVRVLADEVRPGTDSAEWWYVPVSYQEDPANMYLYYDAFARIEEEIEDSEHVSVLLVPRITHIPA